MNQFYLIIFLIFSVKLSAQDNTVTLHGKIISDSLSVENVHILNIKSKKGSISNQKGMFEIRVQKNDTLLFSALQFYSFEVIINDKILKSKYIEIELIQKINSLNEIVIKSHNLQGNLTIDSKNFIDTIQSVNPMAVALKMNVKPASYIVARRLDPEYLADVTDPMVPIGGDLIGLFRPLIKQISKIGKSKRQLKQYEVAERKKINEAPEKIRTEFGDTFFIEKLGIPKSKIDEFIQFCSSKGILEMYIQNRKIELIEVFINEKKNFNAK